MDRVTRILTAIDVSDPTRAAFSRALTLARRRDAELTLLHAVGKSQPFGWHAHERLAKLAAFRRSAEAAGVRVHVSVQHGDPAGVILLHARSRRPDLIVLGTHQHTGRERVRSGSVAETVTCRAEQPVLIVPAEATETDAAFRNIVSAVDFSQASVRALHAALTLAQPGGGRVTLLHVLDRLPDAMVSSGSRALRLRDEYGARVKRVNRELARLMPADALNAYDVETQTVSGDVHDAVLSIAAERRADLIVLGSPSRLRRHQFASGSTVQRVLRRASCPVLIIRGLPAPAVATHDLFLTGGERECLAAPLRRKNCDGPAVSATEKGQPLFRASHLFGDRAAARKRAAV